MVEVKENYNGTYQKLKFLNKFYLYSSLTKHCEASNAKNKDIFQKSLDLYEKEVMEIFNCDTEWPICLYDFTYKNKIPQYLSFRTTNNLSSLVI